MPELAAIVLLSAFVAAPTPAQLAPLPSPPASPAAAVWSQALTARQRDQLERLLGPSRLRRLERARFHLRMSAAEPFSELSDKPATFEEVRDSLKGAYLKLLQTSLEESLAIDAWLDRVGERIGSAGDDGNDDGVALRIAPRLHLGSRSSVGVKLGLRSGSKSMWSRPSLELRRRIDDPSYGVTLRFDDGERFLLLEHRSDDGRHGESWSLDLRFTF